MATIRIYSNGVYINGASSTSGAYFYVGYNTSSGGPGQGTKNANIRFVIPSEIGTKTITSATLTVRVNNTAAVPIGSANWNCCINVGKNVFSGTETLAGVNQNNRKFSRTFGTKLLGQLNSRSSNTVYCNVKDPDGHAIYNGAVYLGYEFTANSTPYLDLEYEDAPVIEPPSIVTYLVERYANNVKAIDGDKCWLNLAIGGMVNLTSVTITVGENVYTRTLPSGTRSYTVNNDKFFVIDGSETIFNVTSDYDFYLEVSDEAGNKTSQNFLLKGYTPNVTMHISKDKTRIGIGGYAQPLDTDEENRLDVYMPAYFHGGIHGGSEQTIITGRVDNTSVAANSYADVNVSFGRTFSAVPNVLISPESGSTAVNMGSVSFALLTGSITTTGFKIRIFNNTSNSRGYAFRWIAF